MSVKLSDLDPEVEEAARKAINLLNENKVPFVITSTLRTLAEQIALFAQGRADISKVNALRAKAGLRSIGDSENRRIVTNCDGIDKKSRHQSGRALDVVPRGDNGPIWPPPSDLRWTQIASAFTAEGFMWGGDWKKFPDYPHYEM